MGKNHIEDTVAMQQLPNLYISAIKKKNVRDLKVWSPFRANNEHIHQIQRVKTVTSPCLTLINSDKLHEHFCLFVFSFDV